MVAAGVAVGRDQHQAVLRFVLVHGRNASAVAQM